MYIDDLQIIFSTVDFNKNKIKLQKFCFVIKHIMKRSLNH